MCYRYIIHTHSGDFGGSLCSLLPSFPAVWPHFDDSSEKSNKIIWKIIWTKSDDPFHATTTYTNQSTSETFRIWDRLHQGPGQFGLGGCSARAWNPSLWDRRSADLWAIRKHQRIFRRSAERVWKYDIYMGIPHVSKGMIGWWLPQMYYVVFHRHRDVWMALVTHISEMGRRRRDLLAQIEAVWRQSPHGFSGPGGKTTQFMVLCYFHLENCKWIFGAPFMSRTATVGSAFKNAASICFPDLGREQQTFQLSRTAGRRWKETWRRKRPPVYSAENYCCSNFAEWHLVSYCFMLVLECWCVYCLMRLQTFDISIHP